MSLLIFRLFGFSVSLFLPLALVIFRLPQLLLCHLHHRERVIGTESGLLAFIAPRIRIAPNIFALTKRNWYFFINHFAFLGVLLINFAVPWLLLETTSSCCVLKAHGILILKLLFAFCPLRLCFRILLSFLGAWLIVAKKIHKPMTIHDRSVALLSRESI